jgi:hypothetical protein
MSKLEHPQTSALRVVQFAGIDLPFVVSHFPSLNCKNRPPLHQLNTVHDAVVEMEGIRLIIRKGAGLDCSVASFLKERRSRFKSRGHSARS